MIEYKVGIADAELKLAHRRRSPKLDNTHIQLLVHLVHRDLGHALDPVLYGASDMRNDLHGFSEVVGTFLPR